MCYFKVGGFNGRRIAMMSMPHKRADDDQCIHCGGTKWVTLLSSAIQPSDLEEKNRESEDERCERSRGWWKDLCQIYDCHTVIWEAALKCIAKARLMPFIYSNTPCFS